MSHRLPPEDRVPGLRFLGWVLVWMAAVLAVWYGVWSVVA
jgi:hypothetical protein